ncbi:MAG TPA: histidine phosphatase family protein [Allosphingosinicella sp.]|nr:histidine phosphatase family protein [Allosphingosinicella sp.]
MKILTLLRHAKSTWDDPVARDFDRPLNKRGRRAARTIGREMQAQGLEFDQVIASPAVRVIETLADVEDGYGHPLNPAFDKRVYLASKETLLDIVQGADDRTERLLIVGHNPGLETLAMLLTRGEGLRAEVAIKYPTATLAEISLPVDHWSETKEGVGTIARFIRPRDLDPELGPDEDSY